MLNLNLNMCQPVNCLQLIVARDSSLRLQQTQYAGFWQIHPNNLIYRCASIWHTDLLTHDSCIDLKVMFSLWLSIDTSGYFSMQSNRIDKIKK